ncbi:hypothetical protein HOY80DRAFT_411770 [Tuber brumale]|nr:hypothetical protein HOY80DRAFT_411770 [Tuber brumale]
MGTGTEPRCSGLFFFEGRSCVLEASGKAFCCAIVIGIRRYRITSMIVQRILGGHHKTPPPPPPPTEELQKIVPYRVAVRVVYSYLASPQPHIAPQRSADTFHTVPVRTKTLTNAVRSVVHDKSSWTRGDNGIVLLQLACLLNSPIGKRGDRLAPPRLRGWWSFGWILGEYRWEIWVGQKWVQECSVLRGGPSRGMTPLRKSASNQRKDAYCTQPGQPPIPIPIPIPNLQSQPRYLSMIIRLALVKANYGIGRSLGVNLRAGLGKLQS